MSNSMTEHLIVENTSKIALMLFGGLGGIQSGPNMLTELQQAYKPNLDALIKKSMSGLMYSIAPGITPCKGIDLLALLGYNAFDDKYLQNMVAAARNGKKADGKYQFSNKFKLNSCIISSDPFYCKIAGQLGIEPVETEANLEAHFEKFLRIFKKYDFVVVHIADTDKYGLLGEYYEKIKVIEQVDSFVPKILNMKPDVFAVTGDHSSPTALAEITWHPVPILIHAKNSRYDTVQTFDEVACNSGGLGTFNSQNLLPLILAHARRLRPLSV